MADENKNETKKVEAKSEGPVVRLEAKGPTNELSGAEILRFRPSDKRKKTMDIRQGQILTVGKEITEEEADRLKSLSIWNFKEVKE